MRALLIDLGNVLVRFDHGITLRKIALATGLPEEQLRSAAFSDLERALDRGALSPSSFFRAVEERLSVPPLGDEVWIEAWRDIFEPIPESLDLLRRRSVTAVLVSNTNAVHWEGVLRVAPIDRLVDAWTLSFEVGASKPDPRIYAAALRAAGAEPGEAVFADDKPEFVEAARSLGIDGFVVDSPATLERELTRRGLVG